MGVSGNMKRCWQFEEFRADISTRVSGDFQRRRRRCLRCILFFHLLVDGTVTPRAFLGPSNERNWPKNKEMQRAPSSTMSAVFLGRSSQNFRFKIPATANSAYSTMTSSGSRLAQLVDLDCETRRCNTAMAYIKNERKTRRYASLCSKKVSM